MENTVTTVLFQTLALLLILSTGVIYLFKQI